jgi:uncharacterized protein YjbI with pentapeptide repeats
VAVGNLYISRRNLQQQRVLEEQRAQDDALQAYYTQLGDLLTKHDLKKTMPEDNVALLARAQTLTVVGRVDARRKGNVVRFLHGARLISGDSMVVDVGDADLRDTSLHRADLAGAVLSGADFSGADLGEAVLRGADLSRTDLGGANLGGANIGEADLRNAHLSGAYLVGASLWEANLRRASLFEANLSEANLFEASLRWASLSGAALIGTNFDSADLGEAVLRGADLSGAYLAGANLSGATGITYEELERQAASLEGATMPNGQKYEDWLKDREGRKEDAENE